MSHMRKPMLISTLLILILCCSTCVMAASDATADHKAGSDKGSALDDLGRGLKSAAKNIGDEIPKIGPAIGDTFKKITGQDNTKERTSKKSSAQRSKDTN